MSNKMKQIFIPVLIVIALASCTASNSKTLNEIDQTMIIKKPSSYSASETIDRLENILNAKGLTCLLYTSPSPRDLSTSRMPSSA